MYADLFDVSVYFFLTDNIYGMKIGVIHANGIYDLTAIHY